MEDTEPTPQKLTKARLDAFVPKLNELLAAQIDLMTHTSVMDDQRTETPELVAARRRRDACVRSMLVEERRMAARFCGAVQNAVFGLLQAAQ